MAFNCGDSSCASSTSPSTCYYLEDDTTSIKNQEQTQQQTKITQFQKRVYDVTRLIPKGHMTTYGAIAKHLNCKSAQAIGQALKKNPNSLSQTTNPSIMVPCHRVISSDLHIGGFSGHKKGPTIERKIKYLKDEGINFVKKKWYQQAIGLLFR